MLKCEIFLVAGILKIGAHEAFSICGISLATQNDECFVTSIVTSIVITCYAITFTFGLCNIVPLLVLYHKSYIYFRPGCVDKYTGRVWNGITASYHSLLSAALGDTFHCYSKRINILGIQCLFNGVFVIYTPTGDFYVFGPSLKTLDWTCCHGNPTNPNWDNLHGCFGFFD